MSYAGPPPDDDALWVDDLMSAMSAVLGTDDEAIDLATDLLEAIRPHIDRDVRDTEANAAAVARDAKVAEIVAEWLGSDNAPWPMTRALEHTIAIAALYGATRDHIAALRAVDDSDIVPGSEFDGPVIL